jgi:hypothetical protein
MPKLGGCLRGFGCVGILQALSALIGARATAEGTGKPCNLFGAFISPS